MADFHAGVTACATDFEETGVAAANCFKSKKVEVRIAVGKVVKCAHEVREIWRCVSCWGRPRRWASEDDHPIVRERCRRARNHSHSITSCTGHPLLALD